VRPYPPCARRAPSRAECGHSTGTVSHSERVGVGLRGHDGLRIPRGYEAQGSIYPERRERQLWTGPASSWSASTRHLGHANLVILCVCSCPHVGQDVPRLLASN
jgi:hypothetical protein